MPNSAPPPAISAVVGSLGQRSSKPVAANAAAQIGHPPGEARSTAIPADSNSPAATGAKPRSIAPCHGRPRHRPHTFAITYMSTAAGT